MAALCRAAVLPLLLAAALPAWAGPYTIDLEARCGKAKQTAKAEAARAGGTAGPRAVLAVKPGGRLRIAWTVQHAETAAEQKDVIVHLFLVKEEKLGQAAVPRLDRDVTLESALSMDFKPKDRAKGQSHVVLDKPGAYLLRVETIGPAGKVESFAALDVDVR